MPDGVTEIAADAFKGAKIKTVSIPDSCTRIGSEAFCGCEKLTKVTLPDNGLYLAHRCFAQCGKLAEIDLPESLVFGTEVFTVMSGDKLGAPSPLSVSVGGTIGMMGRVWVSGMRHTESGELCLELRESKDAKTFQVSFDGGQAQISMNYSFGVTLRQEDGSAVKASRSEVEMDLENSVYIYRFWFGTDKKPARIIVSGPKATVELSGVYWREMKPWMEG